MNVEEIADAMLEILQRAFSEAREEAEAAFDEFAQPMAEAMALSVSLGRQDVRDEVLAQTEVLLEANRAMSQRAARTSLAQILAAIAEALQLGTQIATGRAQQ